MTMMNNARPVTAKDVAEKLGKSAYSVAWYLGNKQSKDLQTPTAILVRKTAQEMGYKPRKEWTHAERPAKFYWNGNFHTKEEEVARMKELRAQGYSNAEIAKAIGRTRDTVWRSIGKQDPELAKQNVAMASHIRAQKNAARKQFVINKSIAQYNAKVEKHNKMKAELNALQVELLTEKPEIMKAAQTEIKFPMVDLKTLQPTALQ